MKTNEQMRAELEADMAAKLAENTKRLAIAERLPTKPEEVRAIHIFKPEPWVVYEVQTLAEAIALAERFPPALDLYAVTHGCTYVRTVQYERGTLKWHVPNAYELKQHAGIGFFSGSLRFHVDLGDVRVTIVIDVKGFPYKHRGGAYRDNFGHVKKQRPTIPGAAQAISWGGSDESVMHSAYFIGLDGIADLQS